MKWTCPHCGYTENAGRFCDRCGLPPEYRMKRNPFDGKYPTLAEVRAYKETHGPLIACTWSGYSNGMSYMSHTEYRLTLKKQDGVLTLDEYDMQQGVHITTRQYRADEAALARLQEIAERENLAAWEYLKISPQLRETIPVIMDFSSSAHITLTFDDTAVGSRRPAQRSIDCEAARLLGGGDVLDEVRSLLSSCKADSALISEETTAPPNPFAWPNGMGMTVTAGTAPPEGAPPPDHAPAAAAPDGTWRCPHCGEAGLTTKFCPNCGAARP